MKTELIRFTNFFASKKAAKFGVFFIVFGTSLLLPIQEAGAANTGNVQVICATTSGEQRTFTIGWDNSNQFFADKGQISRLYCEGGYAGNYRVFVSNNLQDSSLDYYNGIAPVIVPPVVETPTVVDTPTAPTTPDSPTATVEPAPVNPDTPTATVSDTQTATQDSPTATSTPDSQTAPSDSVTATTPVETPTPVAPVDTSTPISEPTQTPQPVPPVQEPSPTPAPVVSEPVVVAPEPAPVQPQPVPDPDPVIAPPAPAPEEPLPPAPEPPAPVEPEPAQPVPADPIPADPQPIPADPQPIPADPAPVPVDIPTSQEQPSSPIAPSQPEPFVPSPDPVSILNVDVATLPPETPVELENGVILTAEVVVALELLDNPGELLASILTNPAQALKAIANIGADMTPEDRKKAQTTTVAAVLTGVAIRRMN